MAIMDDFVGFSFNNHHSSEYGILRVSDGSRYQETLIPTSEDYTADIPGGDGQYYFGSNYKTKQFNIQIAFDKVTEIGLRKIRQWLGINTTGELIFDEEPYKIYNVKVTGEPNLSYICFREKGKRVYKGEGNINFTAFYPYAHAKIDNSNNEPYGLSWYRGQISDEVKKNIGGSPILNYELNNDVAVLNKIEGNTEKNNYYIRETVSSAIANTSQREPIINLTDNQSNLFSCKLVGGIQGNSQQEQGRNWFDINNMEVYKNEHSSGISITDDKIILTASKAFSENAYVNVQFKLKNLYGKKGSTFRLSFIKEVSGNNSGQINLSFYKTEEDGTKVNIATLYNGSGITTSKQVTEDYDTVVLVCYVVAGSGTLETGDTVTYSNIIITIDEEGDNTYEPFVAEKPSIYYPNLTLRPALPTKLIATGKNILPFDRAAGSDTNNGITFSVDSNKVVTISGELTEKSKPAQFWIYGTYGSNSTIVWYSSNLNYYVNTNIVSENINGLKIRARTSDGSITSEIYSNGKISDKSSFTNKSINGILIELAPYTTLNNPIIVRPQLQMDESTTYEPYKRKENIISETPLELAFMGTGTGLYDYYDCVSGILEKNIERIEFTGNEFLANSNTIPPSGFLSLTFNPTISKRNASIKIVCNYFKSLPNINISNTTENFVWANPVANQIGFCVKILDILEIYPELKETFSINQLLSSRDQHVGLFKAFLSKLKTDNKSLEFWYEREESEYTFIKELDLKDDTYVAFSTDGSANIKAQFRVKNGQNKEGDIEAPLSNAPLTFSGASPTKFILSNNNISNFEKMYALHSSNLVYNNTSIKYRIYTNQMGSNLFGGVYCYLPTHYFLNETNIISCDIKLSSNKFNYLIIGYEDSQAKGLITPKSSELGIDNTIHIEKIFNRDGKIRKFDFYVQFNKNNYDSNSSEYIEYIDIEVTNILISPNGFEVEYEDPKKREIALPELELYKLDNTYLDTYDAITNTLTKKTKLVTVNPNTSTIIVDYPRDLEVKKEEKNAYVGIRLSDIEETFNSNFIITNRFKRVEGDTLWSSDVEGINMSSANKNEVRVRIPKNQLPGWEEELAREERISLIRTWLTNYPLKCLFALENSESSNPNFPQLLNLDQDEEIQQISNYLNSSNIISNGNPEFSNYLTDSASNISLKIYSPKYETLDEWEDSSQLLEYYPSTDNYNIENNDHTINCYNAGDLESDFILSFKKEANANFKVTFSQISSGSGSFTIEAKRDSDSSATNFSSSTSMQEIIDKEGTIVVDSYKRTITFEYEEEINGKKSPKTISSYFLLSAGNFFKIPIGESLISVEKTGETLVSDIKLSYNYLYY